MSGRQGSRRGGLRRALLRVLLVLFTFAFLGGAAVLGLVARYAAELPPVESLRDYNPSIVTRVLGADGSVIGDFFVERRVVLSAHRCVD